MSRGGQATLGDSFGGDPDPETPDRSQRPERTPTRSPTREESGEVREDPDDDARDEGVEEAVEDVEEDEDDDRLPSPEDMDPARVEDDEDGSTSRRGTPGSRKTEWGPCKVCGEMSDKCYKCSNCGKPW